MSVEVHLDNVARQGVLDAVLELQCCRRSAVESLRAGTPEPGAEVVASGDITAWTMRRSWGWRHLLSTRSGATADSLSRSLPNNRKLCRDNGLQMVSVFDYDSTDDAARALLEGEPSGSYFYAYAPVQIKLVDRREVLIQGPADAGAGSLVSLTSSHALRAAWVYWHAVMKTTVPCHPAADRPDFTDRQLQVLQLLREDLTDERIAKVLEVSVRTVRSDVGAVMELLQVHSRFAAGYALAALNNGRRRHHPPMTNSPMTVSPSDSYTGTL